MNDLFDQTQADLTKEHLFYPMLAPVDVTVIREKLKNMENILRDTQKLIHL